MKNTRYPAKTACAALCAAALLAMTATAVTTPAARAASASDSPQVLWSFSENFDSYDTSLKLPAQNASWFGIDDANHSIKAWDSPNTALGNFLNLPRYNTGTWKSDRYVAHAIAPTAPDQTAAAQTDHIEFSFQVSMQRDYGFIGFGASLAYGSTATIDANPHLLMIRINQDASDQPVLSYTAWEGSAQTTVTVSGTGTGIADMNRYTGYLVSISVDLKAHTYSFTIGNLGYTSGTALASTPSSIVYTSPAIALDPDATLPQFLTLRAPANDTTNGNGSARFDNVSLQLLAAAPSVPEPATTAIVVSSACAAIALLALRRRAR